MTRGTNSQQNKWSVGRIILISIVSIILIAAIFLYNNFNKLLSNALKKSFESTLVSDVYELQFEDLWVNPFEGTIRVYNVSLQLREKPLHEYAYINSSFSLKTKKITLKNVEIFTLLRSNQLVLERISITQPDVETMLKGDRHIMIPFKDSSDVIDPGKEVKKKLLRSFMLKEFQLKDASFHVTNTTKDREFTITNFDVSLYNLLLDEQTGAYITSFDKVDLFVGEFTGKLEKDIIRHMGVSDFKIGIDSLKMQMSLDTVIHQFHDYNTSLKALEVQTKDSLFYIAIGSFDLSYKNKSIKLKSINFQPNVTNAELQKKHQYQHTDFAGSLSTLDINQINFDSLIYAQKLLIDEILLDSAMISIFKDRTKPFDSTRRPVYLGQSIEVIPLPLHIKSIKATHAHVVNTERLPDSTYAEVNITRGTAEVKNINNISSKPGLMIKADAYINDIVHFNARLTFQYDKPEYSFEGTVEEFNLPDLNPLILAYTPAKINQGFADKISFSGIAEQTEANGIMSFLYHDLEIDLELDDKAKWKSSVLAFAANTVLKNSNPNSKNVPPRTVDFHIERDITKGFINLLIKSLLNGLKETLIMSKENRQEYKETKKELKQENKKADD